MSVIRPDTPFSLVGIDLDTFTFPALEVHLRRDLFGPGGSVIIEAPGPNGGILLERHPFSTRTVPESVYRDCRLRVAEFNKDAPAHWRELLAEEMPGLADYYRQETDRMTAVLDRITALLNAVTR